RLRAPAVRGHGPEGELAVPLAHRIDAHLTKHAEVPQPPFTFLDAREIEGIAAIEQQAPADDRLPRAHVQLVRQAGDPVGRRVLAVEDVAVLNDDRVDRLGIGRADRRTDGLQYQEHAQQHQGRTPWMRWRRRYRSCRRESSQAVKYRLASIRPARCRDPRVWITQVPRTESGRSGRHRDVTVAYAAMHAQP